MELVSIETALEFEESKVGGRSKAVNSLATRLNVTAATLYRWLKSGDHFVCDEANINCESVFKLVKCIEA